MNRSLLNQCCTALLLSWLIACGSSTTDTYLLPQVLLQPPPCPEGVAVAAGASLQEQVNAAAPGATLCLQPGIYDGPLLIDKALTLWGPEDAIINSHGTGSTIEVKANDVKLLGFTVDGSGGRFDLLDAAVRLRGERIQVEGLHIRQALFGILVERSRKVTLRSNQVQGTGKPALGLRGDGIRLWEVSEALVEHNVIHDSRDMVVWYSSNNQIRNNMVTGSRYGTHFMYSNDNEVTDNRYIGNVVGIFIMYSRNVQLRRNLLARSSGAAGVGLGVKESGNLVVEDNLFLRNTTGTYLDHSPMNLDDANLFQRNVFGLCNTAVIFHSSAERNQFLGCSFRNNAVQVQVQGRGDALGVTWRGNDFDDYQGYDMDGDGTGDLPYELQSLSGDLTSRYPNLAFFTGTPTLGLVDLMGHVMPLFAAKKILVDEAPSMKRLSLEVLDAR